MESKSMVESESFAEADCSPWPSSFMADHNAGEA